MDEDRVGYGRPPAHGRFKPGQSGNPKGRPRGRKNMAILIDDVFTMPVRLTQNGKRRAVTTELAILLRLRERALSGDLRAADKLWTLRATYSAEPDDRPDQRQVSAEDRAILAALGLVPDGEGTDDAP